MYPKHLWVIFQLFKECAYTWVCNDLQETRNSGHEKLEGEIIKKKINDISSDILIVI